MYRSYQERMILSWRDILQVCNVYITEFIRTWLKKISAFFSATTPKAQFYHSIKTWNHAKDERKGETEERGERKKNWHTIPFLKEKNPKSIKLVKMVQFSATMHFPNPLDTTYSTLGHRFSRIYFIRDRKEEDFSLAMSEKRALPLCLPNNCKWDEKTGAYSREGDQYRTSLCVIEAALRKLRRIKGNQLDNTSHVN